MCCSARMRAPTPGRAARPRRPTLASVGRDPREVQIKTTPADEARLTPRRPVHPKAFDDYLQGRYLYWNKRTEENLRKAIEYFQSAIREDPTYAQAYVGLADCYNALGSVQFGTWSPVEGRRRAEEAAAKALEIDPSLA